MIFIAYDASGKNARPCAVPATIIRADIAKVRAWEFGTDRQAAFSFAIKTSNSRST